MPKDPIDFSSLGGSKNAAGQQGHRQPPPLPKDKSHSPLRCVCHAFGVMGAVLTFVRNFVLNLLFLGILVLVVVALNMAGSVSKNLEQSAEIIMGQASKNKAPDHKSPVLYIPLDGTISEMPFSNGRFDVMLRRFNEQLNKVSSHDLSRIERAIKLAASDAGIKELLINVDDARGLSLAAAARIGKAMDEFAALDGHKITAVGTQYSQTAYILASHAQRVVLDPLGGIAFHGVGMQSLFYGPLLQKYKLTPYIFRAGEFKSAVEPFERDSMSEHVKAEYQKVASSLWQTYLEAIKGRESISNDPGIVLPEAHEFVAKLKAYKGDETQLLKDQGIVDDVIPLYALNDEYVKTYGAADKDGLEPDFLDYRDYLTYYDRVKMTSSDKVAVVYGIGEILDYSEQTSAFTPDNVVPLLEEAAVNPEIKALVLYLNSPGGSVYASEQIRLALERVRAKGKSVVVSMNGMCASGAYWVSTAADKLVAAPGTLTGSIGVFAVAPNFAGFLNDWGVTGDGAATHEFAQAYTAKELGPNLKDYLQLSVDHTYQKFVSLVAKARSLPPENYKNYAEGRVFTADEALSLGLIDAEGGYADALKTAMELAGLSADSTEIKPLLPVTEKLFSPLEAMLMQGSLKFLPEEISAGYFKYLMGSRKNSAKAQRPQFMAISAVSPAL